MHVRHFLCFSDLVKAIRRQNSISQRALAKALRVSPGYIGQWELQMSQPSSEVAVTLCRVFGIDDVEYVQRLAYAQRAPEWLRDSIVLYEENPAAPRPLTLEEQRILAAVRRLDADQIERLADRIEGWVEATLDKREQASGDRRF